MISRVIWLSTLAIACMASASAAQVMEFVPVSSTGSNTINGNEIVIPAGGVQVQFDIMISGWVNAPGSPDLGAFLATFDSSSLLGENAVPPNPGFDLGTPTPVPCSADANCASGLCGSYVPGFCDDSQPAFQFRKGCVDDMTIPCSSGDQCPGFPICTENPDFVMTGACEPQTAVDLPTSGDFMWVGACAGTSVEDPGIRKTAGSLRIDVPAGATGTYTISLNDDQELTLLNDAGVIRIAGVTLVPGVITLPPAPPIPAASQWGLLVMALALLIVGTLMVKGRRCTHAASP